MATNMSRQSPMCSLRASEEDGGGAGGGRRQTSRLSSGELSHVSSAQTRRLRNGLVHVAVASLLSLGGCTTTWKESGSFYRTTQTRLRVGGSPGRTVHLNNKYVGQTPLTVPLEYRQKVRKKTRRVSFWITQPGCSVFVTILSLGTYLPLSIIPVDIETSLEPMASFRNNEFQVRVSAGEGPDWERTIRPVGEAMTSVVPGEGGGE